MCVCSTFCFCFFKSLAERSYGCLKIGAATILWWKTSTAVFQRNDLFFFYFLGTFFYLSIFVSKVFVPELLTCWRHTGHWSIQWNYSVHCEGWPEPRMSDTQTGQGRHLWQKKKKEWWVNLTPALTTEVMDSYLSKRCYDQVVSMSVNTSDLKLLNLHNSQNKCK